MTNIRFERNAMMALAHLTDSDDGGKAFVFCAIPGGTPQFTFDLQSPHASSVADAPSIDTFAAFKAFVTGRFS